MLEIFLLIAIGLSGAFVIETALASWFLRAWVRDECSAQGPDYIRKHYKARLALPAGLMFAFLLLFAVLDYAWFSRKGIVVNAVRRLPFLSEWGDLGVVAWPLWGGVLLGLAFGAMAGMIVGIYGFPRRDAKCRRVLGLFGEGR